MKKEDHAARDSEGGRESDTDVTRGMYRLDLLRNDWPDSKQEVHDLLAKRRGSDDEFQEE